MGDDSKLYKFNTNDFGFFKNSPGYNSPVVQEWMKYANEWRLTSTNAYKGFQYVMGQYFEANTPEDKDKYSAQLIETARMLLSEVKRYGVPELRKKEKEQR